jgi:hypothetical protein
MSESYREQIARLQAAANESIQAERENRVNELADQTLGWWEEARRHDIEGDHADAVYCAREAGELTREWQAEMAKLPQQISNRKLAWMQRNPQLVQHPHFAPLADFFHNWVTRQMGVPDDSDAYEELMHKALTPGGDYQEDATPNEMVHKIQTTSKYANLGGRFTAQDYNRGVNALIHARRNGYV